MGKLTIFSLMFLISCEIVITKADFFLDDVFGDNFNHFNRHGHSLSNRDSDVYEGGSQASFGLGLNSASFNGNDGFESEAAIQHFPGAQIHRDKNLKKRVDRRLREWNKKAGKYIPIEPWGSKKSKKTEKVEKVDKTKKDAVDGAATTKDGVVWDEPRTYRPSRSFDVTRRFDPFNRYKKEDKQYKKLPDED